MNNLVIEDYGGEATLSFKEDPDNDLTMMVYLLPEEGRRAVCIWNLSPEHADQIADFLKEWANGPNTAS